MARIALLMSQILVVEDDLDIAALHRALPGEGRPSRRAHHLGQRGAAAAAQVRRPISSILDLMLPGMDGLLVCQAMRADPAIAGIPIIMLTARGEEADRMSGLELGADDYVTKPFSPKELVARVDGAAPPRRPRPRRAAPQRYGRSRSTPIATPSRSTARTCKLTAKEFLLLQYLVQHKGRVLSRDLLLSDVWGYNYTGGTRTVDVHIRRLREKLPPLADAHRDHQAVRLQARRAAVTFRTRLFLTSLITAAVTLLVATMLVSVVDAPDHGRAHRAIARQPGAAGWPKRCRIARPPPTASSTRRPMRSTGWSSARVTFVAPDGAVIGDSDLDGDALRDGREPRRAAGDRRGAPRRPRRREALQHDAARTDMLYVAVPVRNPALPALGFGPAGPAADRCRPAAGRRPPQRVRRVRRRRC